MTGFQSGIQKFKDQGYQVIGISTDNVPSLSHWAKEVLKLDFPLGSDFAKRSVAESYGVLLKDRGIANRATFVVDGDGKISYIEEGSSAVDISGALTACSRKK
ncbi:MAG: hypothetical protein OHK0021_12890 [Bryobacter sp.]